MKKRRRASIILAIGILAGAIVLAVASRNTFFSLRLVFVNARTWHSISISNKY